MVDLATFGDNVDSERYESTMQSTRIARKKQFILSNQGPPGDKITDWPNEELYYNAGENVNADLQEAQGFGVPAITFKGDWWSNSAQVLVNYQMGNTNWANKEV